METKQSITIKPLKCVWCKYEWYPRKMGELPKQCPKCKIYEWNITKDRIVKKPKHKDKKSIAVLHKTEKPYIQEVKKPRKSLFDDLIQE